MLLHYFPLVLRFPSSSLSRVGTFSSASGNNMSAAAAVSQLACLTIPQSKPPLFPCSSVLTSTHSPFPCVESPRCFSVHRRCPRSLPFPFSQSIPFPEPQIAHGWHLDGVSILLCTPPQVSSMLPCSVPLKVWHYLSRGCPSGLKDLGSS
eukprot:g77283.t1